MAKLEALRSRGEEGGSRPTARERWIRTGVARVFSGVEDLAYVGLGLVLGAAAVALLVQGAIDFGHAIAAGALADRIASLLDRMLLILMIVEILYTVQVSFREHALVPEPFLIVGLIAATRRVLVLTAEVSKLVEKGDTAFRNAMLELALLTAMVLALVGALAILRKRAPTAVADKA